MKYFLSAVASLLYAASAVAQGTFDEVVTTIINNNEELKSQSLMNVAQILDESDANSLANPSVSFARVWGRHGIGNKLQLDIGQEFDWPALYSARSQATDVAMTVGAAEYEAARFELSVQARQLLTELVYVRRQKSVLDDLKHNFNDLSDAIDKGVRGGELTILDQRKMQIESYEIDNDMCRISSREQQIIAALAALCPVALDLSAVTSYPIQPLLSLQQYLDEVPNDPNVIAMRLQADMEVANAKVASRSRLPSFSVGYQHQAEMGDRFNGFTVGMSLPFFQNRNAKKAALQRHQAAEAGMDNAATKRVAEITGTYSDLQIFRGRIEAYNKAFGDNKYLEILMKAYKGGQISVIEYLSELHYYHQTMLAYLESEYNYNQALSSLNCYQLYN